MVLYFLVISLIFYVLSLLQNSFFWHFSLMGTVPDLVFIFFSLLVFFCKKNNYYEILIYSVIAGLLSDVFSASPVGVSVVIYTIIGFLMQKAHTMLTENKGLYPLSRFLPLWFFSYLSYLFVAKFIISGLILKQETVNWGTDIIWLVIYNLVIAIAGYYACAKWLPLKSKNRQLPLFK